MASVEAGQDEAGRGTRGAASGDCGRLTREGGRGLITARAACEASTVLPGLRVMKQGGRGDSTARAHGRSAGLSLDPGRVQRPP